MHDTDQESLATPTESRSFLGVGLAVLLAAAAFLSGLQLGSWNDESLPLEAGLFSFLQSSNTAAEGRPDLEEFWRVWDLLEQKYVAASSTDTRSREEHLWGAISGLVESYDDPYTVFLPPAEATLFEEDISGNFSGVGMEVGIRDGVITVIAPLPETPAIRAGIVAGDVVLDIDGQSTATMSLEEAVRAIRGEKGSTVALTVYRQGESEPLTFTIVRDTIAIPTIATETRDDVFIITLYSFNALSEMKMQEALREYVESNKRKLILDVRGNPGGFLQSAISIASYFVPAGEVVVQEDFGGTAENDVYRSSGKTLRQYTPEKMVVLVDGGSASASEILAGALQEHGVATLIGQQTFGKGSVQELVDLPSGASLKVTIARWLTPKGTSISDGGLTPDIIIGRTPQQVVDGEDPQLDAALRFMRGEVVENESDSNGQVEE